MKEKEVGGAWKFERALEALELQVGTVKIGATFGSAKLLWRLPSPPKGKLMMFLQVPAEILLVIIGVHYGWSSPGLHDAKVHRRHRLTGKTGNI